jgi:hypothetical protein
MCNVELYHKPFSPYEFILTTYSFIFTILHATTIYTSSFSSITKLDSMSNLIKEGYFNLSTTLNLKSLWKYDQTFKPKTRHHA